MDDSARDRNPKRRTPLPRTPHGWKHPLRPLPLVWTMEEGVNTHREMLSFDLATLHGPRMPAVVLLVVDDTSDPAERLCEIVGRIHKLNGQSSTLLSAGDCTFNNVFTLADAATPVPPDEHFEGIKRGQSDSRQPFYRGLKRYRKRQ